VFLRVLPTTVCTFSYVLFLALFAWGFAGARTETYRQGYFLAQLLAAFDRRILKMSSDAPARMPRRCRTSERWAGFSWDAAHHHFPPANG